MAKNVHASAEFMPPHNPSCVKLPSTSASEDWATACSWDVRPGASHLKVLYGPAWAWVIDRFSGNNLTVATWRDCALGRLGAGFLGAHGCLR